MFGGLFYVSHVAEVSVTPNFWWYNFCGVLWGMSVVIPGMTSSSVMMALGLYQPMLDGLANLDLLVLSASLPGMGLADYFAGAADELVLPDTLFRGVSRHFGNCAGLHPGDYSHGI